MTAPRLLAAIGSARRRLARLRRRNHLRMAVELTNHCNFACTYCPHSTRGQPTPDDVNRFDRAQGFMSDETFGLCLANARKYAHSVSISFFGEQMLHPRFADLIRSVPPRRPYQLITNTNGSLLTERSLETLKLFDVVRFSIDSADSDSFERLRPGGAILTIGGKRGVNRYRALAEKIEHWLSLPDHPPTCLVYVKTQSNRDAVQEYLDHWLPLMPPDDHVIVKSVLSYGGAVKDPYMTENPCTIPRDDRLVVAWNGDCTPCNLDVNVALCIGNIHRTPDLRRLLASGRAGAVLRGIRRNQGICRNCNDANNHQETMLYPGERDTGLAGSTRALSRQAALAFKRQTGTQEFRRAA